MKKLWLVLIFLCCSYGYAEDTQLFTTDPAPAQEYHAAGDSNNTADTANQSTTVPQSPLVSPASISATAAIANSTADENVEGQLSQLTQSTLTFEQQADVRIQNLVDSNHAIGSALRGMSQNIAMLQQQMGQLPASSTSVDTVFGMNAQEFQGMVMGAGGVMLLGIGILFGQYLQRRSRIGVVPRKSVDIESEYDFMGTNEAIPAKLDLARSYIAMNDFVQAKQILKTVIEKGDDAQRAEAGLLFHKMLGK